MRGVNEDSRIIEEHHSLPYVSEKVTKVGVKKG